MSKRAILISTQEGDWEALYVDGQLVDQGHTLNQGTHGLIHFTKLAEDHNFTSSDVVVCETSDEDEDYLMSSGRFPATLADLKGNYVN